MMQADQLLASIAILRMRAESQLSDLKALELQIREAVKATRQPVGPVTDTTPDPDCKCPAVFRTVISKVGEPGRTKCSKCDREHAS